MRKGSLLIHMAAAGALLATAVPVGRAVQAGATYAIRGGRVFTAAGAPVENGTVVIRNGVIESVGANVTVPADAIVIDAAGHNVYPGLIDMGNSAPIAAEAGAAGRAGGAPGAGGGRGGAGGGEFATYEESERAKRAALLQPDFNAAERLQPTSAAQVQLASAGITTVLAIPDGGIFRGQSALVNVLVSSDRPQISETADYRTGLAVVKARVASHINPGGRAGGSGYPNSLLGSVAFTKQGLHDAQWQRDAEAQYIKNGSRGARPLVEPSLDALRPVLSREMPAAIDANDAREIDRALAIAAEFRLDPIIVGGQGAAERTAELSAAKARVILSLNLPGGRGGAAGAGGGGGGGGGRGGGAAQPSLRELQRQRDAPKVAAALAKAGIPFAFTSGGLGSPADFIRNAGRVIREGGLAADAALRALTIDAARIAGAAERTGSLERGKAANIVVTEGDLFDGGRVRHVFIDGQPVQIDVAPAGTGGRGRGVGPG